MLAFGSSAISRSVNVVRQPAVRIERAGEPVHADPAAVELELLDAAGDRIRPGLGARPHVARPSPARARQPSRKVGICTIEVGSPTAGNTSTLNSALPPIGQR